MNVLFVPTTIVRMRGDDAARQLSIYRFYIGMHVHMYVGDEANGFFTFESLIPSFVNSFQLFFFMKAALTLCCTYTTSEVE